MDTGQQLVQEKVFWCTKGWRDCSGTRECIVVCRQGRDNTSGQTCDIKQFVHRNGNPPEKLCNLTGLSGKEGSRRTNINGGSISPVKRHSGGQNLMRDRSVESQ